MDSLGLNVKEPAKTTNINVTFTQWDAWKQDYSTQSKPVWVGNIYFDRSGKEPKPMVFIEEMDPMLTDEIDSWVQDVIYAVKNNEDASRDIPAAYVNESANTSPLAVVH
jgi:hypothetical protein